MPPGVNFAQVSEEAKEEEAKIRTAGLHQCTQNRQELPNMKDRIDELKKLLKNLGY